MAQVVVKFDGRELGEILHGKGGGRPEVMCAQCSWLQKRLTSQKMVARQRLPGMVTGRVEKFLYPFHEFDPVFVLIGFVLRSAHGAVSSYYT